MKMKKFSGTERTVLQLVQPIVENLGYSIWDVSFEKEGAYWYLRVFADHPDGMTIADCETLTRPINEAVDQADPIAQAYVLEVGSAGLERTLNQPEHFASSIGMEVRARAIRPKDGVREWIGTLTAFDETQITLSLRDTQESVTLTLAEMSYVKRYVDIDF